MPGYGYAKEPPKVVEKCKLRVRDYLRGRQVLGRVLVLVDSRHGLKDVDREMTKMLDAAAMSYRVVLTKADKISASDLERVATQVGDEARRNPAAFPLLPITSAEQGMGLADMRVAVLAEAGV